jgi:hypothetical protein
MKSINTLKIQDFPTFLQPFVSSVYFLLVPIFANLFYIIAAVWTSDTFPWHVLLFILAGFTFPLGLIVGYISIPLLIFTLLGA